MNSKDHQAIYEALTEICSVFSQRPQHHHDRLTLLAHPANEWIKLHRVLEPSSKLAERVLRLEDLGANLLAQHTETPDGQWALVNFYCGLIDAIPATALLLKRAHTPAIQH